MLLAFLDDDGFHRLIGVTYITPGIPGISMGCQILTCKNLNLSNAGLSTFHAKDTRQVKLPNGQVDFGKVSSELYLFI